MKRGVRAGVGAALASMALGRSAGAAQELTWIAPPGCPGLAGVQAAFRRMSVHSSPTNVRAVATIRREADGYHLDLSLAGKSGAAEIQLAAADCATLADVVALQLALASDARAATAARHGPPPSEDEGPRFSLGIFAGGSAGSLPGFAPGFRATLGLELPAIRIEAGGKQAFGRDATYAGVSGSVGAGFQSTAGFARVCNAFPGVGFGVAVCGGLETGVIRGEGFGTEETFASHQLWAAATAAPALRYAFASGLSLQADGELGVALTRPEFHARGLPTLFSPDRTFAAAWIGVGQRF